MTYVNDGLKLTKNSSDGLSNEGNGVEEACLSDQDVEKHLMDADKLAEGVSNGSGIDCVSNVGGADHRGIGGGGSCDDVGEARDDWLLRESVIDRRGRIQHN